MTPQEAIKILQDNMLGIDTSSCEDTKMVLIMAIKALEKQIPKKPLKENRYYGNGKCPNCGAVFLDKTTKYCGNCGQALDWS